MPLPRDAAHWQERNNAFIDLSAAVIVLMVEGWYNSKGVAAEIDYAFKTGKVVYLYHTNFVGGYDLCEMDQLSYLAARKAESERIVI